MSRSFSRTVVLVLCLLAAALVSAAPPAPNYDLGRKPIPPLNQREKKADVMDEDDERGDGRTVYFVMEMTPAERQGLVEAAKMNKKHVKVWARRILLEAARQEKAKAAGR